METPNKKDDTGNYAIVLVIALAAGLILMMLKLFGAF